MADSANYRVPERDSKKDAAIVFIFIIATGGLLGWAVFKPWVEKWLEVRSIIACWASNQWTDLLDCAGETVLYACLRKSELSRPIPAFY